MNIVDLIQGSPEWLAHRAKHFNASDAPAMLGVSPYKSRAELLREAHTGVAAEVDVATQKRFDNGHRLEALARPLAEEFIGEELYPVVGTKGALSASFDGLTLDERQGFEHKALNAELRAVFASGTDDESGSLLPIYHRVQMEQQLMVSGAERILFMASEWSGDGELIEEHHCWYYSDEQLRQQISDGWLQFERDLSTYELPAAAPAAPVGKAPETLPALLISVTGEVTASNLDAFKATALGAIRAVNRDLKTDQHFADAEKAVKWCAEVESRLKAAKEHALSQTASIDALFKALDDISAEAKAVRLDLAKLVDRRKTEVREEAVGAARAALQEHIAALNAEIAPFRLPAIAADFAGTIKGLRSIQSMQDKLDALLTTTKIAADAEARAIRLNAATFHAEAEGFEFLFADLGQVITKAADDFLALVRSRIAAERQRRADEERRRQEAEARAAEQRRLAEEQAQREAAEAAARAAAAVPAPAPFVVPPFAGVDPKFAPGSNPNNPQEEPVNVEGPEHLAPKPAPGLAFDSRGVLAPIAKPPADEPATLKLGVICERLGFTVSAAFLADALHIKPAKAEGASKLYTETQYQQVCRQLIAHVGAMAELYGEAEAAA